MEMRFDEKSIPAACSSASRSSSKANWNAAHESLAETESRVSINRQQLELAEDAEAV